MFIKASQEELETLARRACTKLGKTAGILYTSPGCSGPWEGKATSLGCSLEEASAEQSLLKWLCWDLLSCGHTKQKSTGLSLKGRCPSERCEDHGPQCELAKWGADMISWFIDTKLLEKEGTRVVSHVNWFFIVLRLPCSILGGRTEIDWDDDRTFIIFISFFISILEQ